MLTNKPCSCKTSFIEYVYYFAIGRYFHFRCMGYMEALVLTKCYSVESLCYWQNMLVIPASNNFMSALANLENVESDKELSSNKKSEIIYYLFHFFIAMIATVWYYVAILLCGAR